MIVCGWSGEWDHALRSAILRAPSRRYSTFWAARGSVGERAKELVSHRIAQEIPIESGETFFTSIAENVLTIQRTHRKNPSSIKLKVQAVKNYLSKDEHKIALESIIADEIDQFMQKLSNVSVSAVGGFDVNEFQTRVDLYEASTETVGRIAGLLGRWSGGDDFNVIHNIISRITTEADRNRSGTTFWLGLRSYPAVLILTSYCLGLVCSKRWGALRRILSAEIVREYQGIQRIVDFLFLNVWEARHPNTWNQLRDFQNQRHISPFNTHIIQILEEYGVDIFGITSDFSATYELWEALACIIYMQKYSLDELNGTSDTMRIIDVPVVRMRYDPELKKKVLHHIAAGSAKETLIRKGFANADVGLFDKIFRCLETAQREVW